MKWMSWDEHRKQRIRRRRARKVVGVMAATVGATCVAGMFLPAEHLRVSQARLERPPETVWRVLTDLDGMPLWRSDLTAVERLPDLGGRPTWREVGKSGVRVVELAQADPPRRMVIHAAQLGRSGRPVRTFDLVAAPGGTWVTATEREHSPNPFRRVFVRLNLPRPALERFLHDLSARLSTTRQVATEPAP